MDRDAACFPQAPTVPAGVAYAMDPAARIDLANRAPIVLGHLRLLPGLRQLERDNGESETLEPRVMQVLVALAEADGAILTRDQLTERCWDGRIVGEDAINRVMSRLRRVAEGIGEGSFRIETINKVGFRLLVVPPEAEPRIIPVDNDGEFPPRMTPTAPKRIQLRSWKIAAIGILIIAVLAFLGSHKLRASEQLIVVEPLAVAVGDRNAQSLRRNLSAALARTIVGNDTTIRIVDPEDVTSAIKRSARYIIAGEAQGNAGRIVASVRLLDAQDATILWSSDFSRAAADSEAIRQEIASKLGDVVICALGADNGGASVLDRETLGLFLAACEKRRNDFGDSARLLRQVVKRAPDFSRGWSMLAVTTGLAAQRGQLEYSPQTFADVRRSATRALALAPNDGQAYMALAMIERDWSVRQAILAKGLSLDPDNPRLLTSYALDRSTAGLSREALTLFRRAAALDPFSPVFSSNLAESLAYSGDLQGARKEIARSADLWPQDNYTGRSHFEIAARLDDPAVARQLLDDPHATATYSADELETWRTLITARSARNAAATQASVSRLLDLADKGPTSLKLQIVQDLAALGRIDDAIAVASRLPRLTPDMQSVWYAAYMAPLRRDRRISPILEKLGLPATWRQTKTLPDFCQREMLPYDCRKLRSSDS